MVKYVDRKQMCNKIHAITLEKEGEAKYGPSLQQTTQMYSASLCFGSPSYATVRIQTNNKFYM